MYAIGAQLTYLRRLRRLSQRELAEKTGLAIATISRLEKDHHAPNVGTLRLLDDALGQQVETVILPNGHDHV